jgi:hypothetical protein
MDKYQCFIALATRQVMNPGVVERGKATFNFGTSGSRCEQQQARNKADDRIYDVLHFCTLT